MLALYVILVFAAAFLLKIHFENRRSADPGYRSPDESEETGQSFISAVNAATSADDLMEIVDQYESISGEENSVLLMKALSLGANLDRDDWAEIYVIAEDDSELKRVADEIAGDSLEEVEVEVEVEENY